MATDLADPDKETQPRTSRGWWAYARVLLGLFLFLAVFALVPLRDRLVWPSQFEEAWVGKLDLDESARQARFDETGGRLMVLENRSPDAGDSWTHVALDGESFRPLTPEESQELAGQPERGLWSVLLEIRLLPFLGAMLCFLVAAILTSWRWRSLLGVIEMHISFWRIQKLTLIGLFFNNVIPGATGGDVVKALYVSRDCQGRTTEAFLSVLLDRAIGLFGLLLLVLLVFPFQWDRFGQFAPFFLLLFGAMVLGGILVFSRTLRRLLRLDRLLARLPGASFFQRIDQALLLYRKVPGKLVSAILVTLVVQAAVLTSVGFVGVALNLDALSFGHHFSLTPIPLIVQVVPLTPAGMGLGEGAFVFVFTTSLGLLPASRSLALALGFRAVQLLISLAGGVCFLTERGGSRIDAPADQGLSS